MRQRRLTGLRAGTPVAVGAGDFRRRAFGRGCDQSWGRMRYHRHLYAYCASLGSPVRDPVISNLHCVTGGWAAFTIVDAAGDAMRWARALLRDPERGYEGIIALAESVPAGSEQLLFLPYLNAERLARRSNSRGQFFGLTSSHGPAHLHRAVMEGVGFASKRNIELMERRGHRFDRMVAAGGGAKSRLWLQIKASMYNCPILVPSEPECGVVGCGILAGCASGLFSTSKQPFRSRFDTIAKSCQTRRGRSDTGRCSCCSTIFTRAASGSGIGLRPSQDGRER